MRTPRTACASLAPPRRRLLWCAAATACAYSSKRRAITICRPICAAGSPRRRSGAARSSSRSTSTRRVFCEALRLWLPLRLLARRKFLPLCDAEGARCPYRKLVGIVVEPVRQPPIGKGMLGEAAGLLAARIGERTGAFAFEVRDAGLIRFQINRVADGEAKHHAVAIESGAGKHAPHRHRTECGEQIADEVGVESGHALSKPRFRPLARFHRFGFAVLRRACGR